MAMQCDFDQRAQRKNRNAQAKAGADSREQGWRMKRFHVFNCSPRGKPYFGGHTVAISRNVIARVKFPFELRGRFELNAARNPTGVLSIQEVHWGSGHSSTVANNIRFGSKTLDVFKVRSMTSIGKRRHWV